MLSINQIVLDGAQFPSPNDSSIIYTSIGFGQDPTSGANYIVGVEWDAVSNKTSIRTFLLKDVKFVGKIPK